MPVKSFFKSHSPVMLGQFNSQNDSWDVKEQTEANREPVTIKWIHCITANQVDHTIVNVS